MRRSSLVRAALCGALLCLLPGTIYAQGSVTGTVRNSDDAPIGGATVRLKDTQFGTLTDGRGNFRLAGIPSGRYLVVGEQVGYVSREHAVAVADGETQLTIRLTESPVALSGVVVTASGVAERHMTATTATTAITGPELRELRASHPTEVISRIAGAWVNVAGSGEGHMTAIRQPLTTNPVYLYLEDGIPTRSTGFFNHNALYEINIPQAGRVEVLKGPGTALYGSDAIGGVINVETRAPSLTPGVEWFAEGAGHEWYRLLASASGSRGRSGFRADMNLTQWGGWRDDTGYDRQSLTVRWDYAPSASMRLKTVAAYSHIDQIDPSPLGPALYEDNPALNEYPVATRSIEAFRLSTSLDVKRAETLFTVTPFLRANRMTIVPSWMLSFDPVTYTTGHRSVGAVARVRRELSSLRGAATFGVDLDYSPGFREEHRIAVTREGAVYTRYERGQLIYDYDVTFAGTSPYAHVEAQPLARLHADLGVRYDRLAYDYRSHLVPLQTGLHRRPADTVITYERVSPKLGLSYDLGRGALFASYRESFRAPSEGQLFRQGSAVNTIDLRPIRAASYEAGVRAAFDAFDFEVVAYDMRVRDDVLTFITANNEREAVNAGETRHRGAELTVGWNVAKWLRFDISHSSARHRYEAWQPRNTVDYSGNEIAAAPHSLSSLRLRVSPERLRGGSVSVEWQAVGSYWEDPENTSKYRGHDLLNARLRLPIWRGNDFVLRVNNIANTRYAEVATFNAFERERLTPGAPRMVYVGIQGRLPRGEQ